VAVTGGLAVVGLAVVAVVGLAAVDVAVMRLGRGRRSAVGVAAVVRGSGLAAVAAAGVALDQFAGDGAPGAGHRHLPHQGWTAHAGCLSYDSYDVRTAG